MTNPVFPLVATDVGTLAAGSSWSRIAEDLFGAALTYGVPICVGALLVYLFFRTRETKVRGPAQTGTAKVLSVRKIGWAVGNPPNQRSACRIGLRVEIPGGEPYEVTVHQNFEPYVLGMAVVPGRTVPVQVEEANPQHVRIDLSQPIPSQSGSDGSTRRVVNLPPRVTFNQSSWSPQAGWSGSPPPADLADQIKAAVEGAFTQSQSGATVSAQQANAFQQGAASAPVVSAAALLASGQRVPASLKSFAATGTTPRSLGRTPSRPELMDAPHYMLEVELHFPNLAPVDGRAIQPVPLAQVPNLAIGLPLTCAVDPADPSHKFVVDWGG